MQSFVSWVGSDSFVDNIIFKAVILKLETTFKRKNLLEILSTVLNYFY